MVMRNLIIVRAGDQSLHPRWTEGSEKANFDLLVSYYGDQAGKYNAGVKYYHVAKGLKYHIIQKCLEENPRILEEYDAFWLPDDDILTDVSTINRMFELLHTQELWLAQPALGAGSFVQHKLTMQDLTTSVRFTNFVEIMCPLFSRFGLSSLFRTFEQSISGWGLDYIWPKILGNPKDRIAILDEVPVIHSRAFQKGVFYRRCRKLKVSPQDECERILKAHAIASIQFETHAVIKKAK